MSCCNFVITYLYDICSMLEIDSACARMSALLYACMRVYAYAYVYVYVWIYIYMSPHLDIQLQSNSIWVRPPDCLHMLSLRLLGHSERLLARYSLRSMLLVQRPLPADECRRFPSLRHSLRWAACCFACTSHDLGPRVSSPRSRTRSFV